ncbi:TetR/AcrR family transcriptional regulator [Neotabrizicola sp. VNH66]|uniref:TetR/AcrR family transcriptional regulator n=1 Tax=Neotabrizicola sp. VNH66 TaxID=3400918 RepID=UPI003BFE694F
MSDDEKRVSIGARRNPETEAAVLDAAEALIREDGYASVTMEAVARRARAGKATVYRWWPSKAHLLLALYSRAKLEIPVPDTGSLPGDMTAYFTPMFARLTGESGQPPIGPILRLLIAEAQTDPSVQDALNEERRARWHHIDRMIARARARGELAPTLPVRRAEQRIVAMIWYLLLSDQLPLREEVPELVEAIVTGMVVPARVS